MSTKYAATSGHNLIRLAEQKPKSGVKYAAFMKPLDNNPKVTVPEHEFTILEIVKNMSNNFYSTVKVRNSTNGDIMFLRVSHRRNYFVPENQR